MSKEAAFMPADFGETSRIKRDACNRQPRILSGIAAVAGASFFIYFSSKSFRFFINSATPPRPPRRIKTRTAIGIEWSPAFGAASGTG